MMDLSPYINRHCYSIYPQSKSNLLALDYHSGSQPAPRIGRSFAGQGTPQVYMSSGSFLPLNPFFRGVLMMGNCHQTCIPRKYRFFRGVFSFFSFFFLYFYKTTWLWITLNQVCNQHHGQVGLMLVGPKLYIIIIQYIALAFLEDLLALNYYPGSQPAPQTGRSLSLAEVFPRYTRLEVVSYRENKTTTSYLQSLFQ